MKPKIVFLGLITGLMISFFHPRLRVLTGFRWLNWPLRDYLSPQVQAQVLWRAREFASIGAFKQVDGLPENIFISTFPQLTSYSYRQILTYSSNTIESLDLIIQQDEARVLATSILGSSIKMNQSHSFTFAGSQWVMAIFDSPKEKLANGYISSEDAENTNMAWIQLSYVKGLPR